VLEENAPSHTKAINTVLAYFFDIKANLYFVMLFACSKRQAISSMLFLMH